MANLFSFSRILLAVLFVYLVAKTNAISASIAIMVIAALTDYLDGYVARKQEKISSFGAILDPAADRIFVVCVCLAIFIKYWQNPYLKLAALIIITRELIIGIGFLWMRTKSVKMEVTQFGKISTALLFISFVVLFVLPNIGIYLLFLAIFVYIIAALDYGQRILQEIDEKN
ncbi:MAG: CDP-alcohol phosphatidyltransferase family protein [Actinobacteria bacterium]|nr:MAG: CDP-alcohol phosphatidyltransferase family protein [Actinomycetota bacterium]